MNKFLLIIFFMIFCCVPLSFGQTDSNSLVNNGESKDKYFCVDDEFNMECYDNSNDCNNKCTKDKKTCQKDTQGLCVSR